MLTAPQHYLAAPSQYLHCVPVLARVAAEVSRVELCTNIIQLTLHHPVEVAETPFFRVGVECYVGESQDGALREALPYVAKKYANYAGWGQDEVLPAEQSFAKPPQELAQGRFIIGDAASVTERILEYREALGMTVFGLRMHWVGMPHALNVRSLHRFCDKVLPAISAGSRRAARSPASHPGSVDG